VLGERECDKKERSFKRYDTRLIKPCSLSAKGICESPRRVSADWEYPLVPSSVSVELRRDDVVLAYIYSG
jgi:hypothetical protein